MKPKAPEGKYIGPFPVRGFLDAFLPCHERFPDTTIVDVKKLGNITEVESNSDLFGPFISVMQECTRGMTFEEANDRDNEIKPGTGDCDMVSDVCLYSEKPETDVDFSPLGLRVMFRPSTAYDPFEDPHSTATPMSNSKGSVPPSPPFVRDYSRGGSQTKSQITSNAFAQLETHSRAFAFSVLILKDEARLIRWDRAGAVVTSRFNYVDHSKLLAKFFWRFTHLSRGEQGHETSIRGLKLCTLSRKLGRATRVSPDEEASCVLDLQALRRRVGARKLDGNQVRGRFECPQPVELRGRNWRYEGIFGECEAKAGSKGMAGKRDDREGEAGYKILLGPAGQPLTSFGSAKEMTQGMLEVVCGTGHAYQTAGHLHHNTCPGNIHSTEQGCAFLIGWDVGTPAEKRSEPLRVDDKT